MAPTTESDSDSATLAVWEQPPSLRRHNSCVIILHLSWKRFECQIKLDLFGNLHLHFSIINGSFYMYIRFFYLHYYIRIYTHLKYKVLFLVSHVFMILHCLSQLHRVYTCRITVHGVMISGPILVCLPILPDSFPSIQQHFHVVPIFDPPSLHLYLETNCIMFMNCLLLNWNNCKICYLHFFL